MCIRSTMCGLVALTVIVFGRVRTASAETLTFDDINATNVNGTPMPSGYGGMNWSNFGVVNGQSYKSVFGTTGYSNGTVSSPNVAYNDNGDEAIVSGPEFTFNSAYFTAAWVNGLNITITGFLDGNQVDSTSFTVNDTGPTLENFNWAVDKLSFVSSGGTTGYGAAGQEEFAMDNMTITAAPLPSTAYAAMGLFGGLGCWMLARGRKACRRI